MPMVNTYYTSVEHKNALTTNIQELKIYLAKALSNGDINLEANEITVRLLHTPSEGMIAPLELKIIAHAFKGRIERQDEICLEIRKYLMELVPTANDVRVWLVLGELGHSWE